MRGGQAEQALRLLDSVRVHSASLQEANRRYADQLAPGFNLINHMRNDEMALSRYLAGLFDIDGVHGQGDLFLRSLTEQLGQCAAWIDPRDLVSVELEKRANGQRRLDIYLVFRNGVVGIENKPWAGDQQDQLSDYAGFLKSSAAGRHWLLVYVCNDDPSEYSIKPYALQELTAAENYCRFDFYQLVNWLESCGRFTRAPKVRLFVDELAGYVRKDVNGEMEMSEIEELKRLILEKNEFIESAFQVAASIGQLKEQVLAELKKELGNALAAQGMTLVWDDSSLRRGSLYAGFGVQFSARHNVHLRFEFGAKGLNSLEWGICRNGANITLDASKSALIREAMEKVFGEGEFSQAWPWYPGQGPRDTFLMQDMRDWSASAKPWLWVRDKTETGFVQRAVKLAGEVSRALEPVHEAMC